MEVKGYIGDQFCQNPLVAVGISTSLAEFAILFCKARGSTFETYYTPSILPRNPCSSPLHDPRYSPPLRILDYIAHVEVS